jgi:hypothetical protein
LSFLPSLDPRIVLWRNAINLFHEYNRPPFRGPFRAAGFSHVVERTLLTGSGGKRKPDIVGSGESGWAVIDLTSDPSSKAEQLASYHDIDPRLLSGLGLHVHAGSPDMLVARDVDGDDGPNCQLIFRDTLEVRRPELVANPTLRSELERARGADFSGLPGPSFTLIPESRGLEVRRGIQSHVLQAFAPNSKGTPIFEIVRGALDCLFDVVSPDDKIALTDSVRDSLRILVKEHLPIHLELKDDVLRARPDVNPHPKTLRFVAKAVREWAGEAPTASKALETFGPR